MPITHGDLPNFGPHVVVHGSAAVELEWALAGADRPDYRRDHPELASLYDATPALAERVRRFWGDVVPESGVGFLELLVLAHHDGRLLSFDGEALIDRLEQLCQEVPAGLPFPSETESDQEILQRRLAGLRESAELRRRYVALIRDLWTAIRPILETSGRGAAEAEAAARRARLADGASWVEVAHNECNYGSLLAELVSGLASGPGEPGTLAVVPAFFTHRGLLLAMPGIVVVGVQTDLSGTQARARTELLARRLRTLADPTRLALVRSLTVAPRTVTELSRLFDLAQPTVSNHVKVLREAGLVTKVRRRSRQELTVDQRAVAELLEHLQTVLGLPLAG